MAYNETPTTESTPMFKKLTAFVAYTFWIWIITLTVMGWTRMVRDVAHWLENRRTEK